MTAHGSWHRVPFSSRLVLHPRSGREAAAVRALAGSSDWRRDLLDRVGAGIVRVAGTAPLPAAEPPRWPCTSWDRLDDELTAAIAGLRLVGAAVPRQHGRARLSLLGRMNGNLVVVKLSGPGDALERERRALELLARNRLPGIATPDVVAAGTAVFDDGPVDHLVTTAIALHRQRPAVDEPLRTFEDDLNERLAALPRPAESTGEVPVHGDLTPWNLRRTPRGLALFDWESAGWGLPGSDLEQYRAASAEIRPPWARSATARTEPT